MRTEPMFNVRAAHPTWLCASHLEREPAGKTRVEICEKIPICQSPTLSLPHLPTGLADRLSSLEPECLYKLWLITSKRGILWMIS